MRPVFNCLGRNSPDVWLSGPKPSAAWSRYHRHRQMLLQSSVLIPKRLGLGFRYLLHSAVLPAPGVEGHVADDSLLRDKSGTESAALLEDIGNNEKPLNPAISYVCDMSTGDMSLTLTYSNLWGRIDVKIACYSKLC